MKCGITITVDVYCKSYNAQQAEMCNQKLTVRETTIWGNPASRQSCQNQRENSRFLFETFWPTTVVHILNEHLPNASSFFAF